MGRVSDSLPDPAGAPEGASDKTDAAPPAAKKPAAKKPAVRKTPARKPATARATGARTASAKPSATTSGTAKTAGAKKPAARKPAARKPAAKRPVTANSAAATASAVKKAPVAPVEVVPPIIQPIDYEALELPPALPRPQIGESVAPAAGGAAGAASDSGDVLVVRGLVKRFGGFTALSGIDLTVPGGSFYGIVGPNGAGKTTTLSIISGFLKADAGSVRIAGIDQAANPRATKRILGILPDRLRTFDRLTGRQLLRYYGLLRGLDSDVIDRRTADLARAFDLTDSLGRVVSDYSAGMTKKLMLAGAMIHSPRVLVLDEPFESVDPVASGIILDILRAYVDHGGTVILSSHGMDLVERVCSRIAVIVGGELLAEGTVEEVSAGQSLESRFMELTGGVGEVEGLEWLHTFSD